VFVPVRNLPAASIHNILSTSLNESAHPSVVIRKLVSAISKCDISCDRSTTIRSRGHKRRHGSSVRGD